MSPNNQQQAVGLDACRAAFHQAMGGVYSYDMNKEGEYCSGLTRRAYRAWQARGEYEATQGDAEGRVDGPSDEEIIDELIGGLKSWNWETVSAIKTLFRPCLRPQPAAKGDGVERLVAALNGYRLHHFLDEGGGHLPLVDLLSVGDTIKTGQEEIELLADHLACEIYGSAPKEQAEPAIQVSAEAMAKLRSALECAEIFAIKNAGQRSAGKLLTILLQAKAILAAMQAAGKDATV